MNNQEETRIVAGYPIHVRNFVDFMQYRYTSGRSLGFSEDELIKDDWIMQYIHKPKLPDILANIFGFQEISNLDDHKTVIIDALRVAVRNRRGRQSYLRHRQKREEELLKRQTLKEDSIVERVDQFPTVTPPVSSRLIVEPDFCSAIKAAFPTNIRAFTQIHCTDVFLEPPEAPNRKSHRSDFTSVIVYAPPYSGKTDYQSKYRNTYYVEDTDSGYNHRYSRVWLTNRPDFVCQSEHSIAIIPEKMVFEERCRKRGLEPKIGWYSDVLYCGLVCDVVIWSNKYVSELLPSPRYLASMWEPPP